MAKVSETIPVLYCPGNHDLGETNESTDEASAYVKRCVQYSASKKQAIYCNGYVRLVKQKQAIYWKYSIYLCRCFNGSFVEVAVYCNTMQQIWTGLRCRSRRHGRSFAVARRGMA